MLYIPNSIYMITSPIRLIVLYPLNVVKQYGRAHISIKPCRIIGTHRLFVLVYIAPKYKPIPIVEITLNRITIGTMPIIPGICPNPKTTDDTHMAMTA